MALLYIYLVKLRSNWGDLAAALAKAEEEEHDEDL